MQKGVVTGLVIYRWAAWVWMAAMAVVVRDRMDNMVLAGLLVTTCLGVTIMATFLAITRTTDSLHPLPVFLELGIGLAVVTLDGYVFAEGHVFSPEQALGVGWPITGVLLAGIAFGGAGGGPAGAAFGLARFAASRLNGIDSLSGEQLVSIVSTSVMYAFAGAGAGQACRLLVRYEREVTEAKARETVARTLHDGVLQTLAIVARRMPDTDIGRLARRQDRELREFLFGDAVDTSRHGNAGPVTLQAALRAAGRRFEDLYGTSPRILIADDIGDLAPDHVVALAGAVGEALANAGKHGAATSVTIYAEPDGDSGVFCSIKDDGRGFDTTSVSEGIGITRSIRGRIQELGGNVDIESTPGSGTEVRIRL